MQRSRQAVASSMVESLAKQNRAAMPTTKKHNMKSTTTTHSTRSGNCGINSAVLLITLLGAMATSALADHNANPGVRPPDRRAFGKTYGEWAAAWQQWAFGIRASQSPFLDDTGQFAGVGQSGPVWFLAGNFGGTSVRNITVPAGKSLFFPVVNSFFIRTEPEEPTDVAGIRAILKGFLPPTYSCEIDGRSVVGLVDYYTESPLFDETLFAANLFGLEPGVYGPAMTAGYYLMVRPLRPGAHTIHFSGLHPNGPGEADDFTLDVTYNITVARPFDPRVVPIDSKLRGRDYGDWAADWFVWSSGIPKAENPVFDMTGEFASVGQHGSVWHLAGTFGGPATRTITVPPGKSLFVPLLNQVLNAPEDVPYARDIATLVGVDPATLTDAEAMRLAVNWNMDHATSLSLTVDGVEVQDPWQYRAETDVFPLVLSDIFEDFGYPAGPREVNVGDGYWVLLRPLKAGAHTIRIQSALKYSTADGDPFDFDFSLDVLYNLTVGNQH